MEENGGSWVSAANNPRDYLLLSPFKFDIVGEELHHLEDEELLDLEKNQLCLKMDDYDEDYCICRRCRSLSNSLITSSGSLPTYNRSRTLSQNAEKKKEEQNPINDVDVRVCVNGDIQDDVPLLLNESYEEDMEEPDHCHVQKPVSLSVKRARQKLIISSCLCLSFMVAEIIGGYFSNSLAIMTDAAHLLSDLASFLISLFALWVGQKAPTKRMSFGYYRAEILGAVISVLIIWVLTGILVYMAIDRVRYQDYEINTDVMLIVAGAGIAMNIVMGIVLHGPCCGATHAHSHGLGSGDYEHSESIDKGNSQNINIRAAFIHVMGDLLQSIGVMVAAYIIHFKPEYKIADPICTFLFSALVMFTTLTIMRDALHVLMEGFPRNLNYIAIKNDLQNLDGVKMTHSLHIWSLTIDRNALAVHLAVDPDIDPHKILREAQNLVRKNYNIYTTTIQIEKFNPNTMLACKTCRGPPL